LAGSQGTVTITGLGTSVTVMAEPNEPYGDIAVGFDGTASLTIEDQAIVTATSMDVGINYDLGVTDTVTVDGATLSIADYLTIGNSGTGTVTIEDDATYDGGGLTIGFNAGSTGTLTVTGVGSNIDLSGFFTIGNSGTGTVIVEDGATYDSSGGNIGFNAGSTGTLTVTGVGSNIDLSGFFTIGNSGTGTVIVEDGATYDSSGGSIGNNAGSTGSLTVAGEGSSFSVTGSSNGVSVGFGGDGNLTVEAGATFTSDFLDIANQVGSTGTVVVEGHGTTLTTTTGQYQNISVGFFGTASLTISDQAVVTTTSMEVAINYDPGVTDTLTVDNATLTVTEGLTIGQAGSANAVFEDGANVTAGSLNVATQPGSTGVLTISGPQTTVETSYLSLGSAGSIQLSDGAVLEVASTIENQGTINVDTGIELSTTQLMIDGTVTLQGPGTVLLQGNTDEITGTSSGTLDNESNISGAGAIGDGTTDLSLDNETGGIIDANASGHTLTINIGGNTITNAGTLEATNGGTLDIDSAVDNTGTGSKGIVASGGTVDVDAAVTDTGAASISNNGVLEFQSSVATGQIVTFDDATGTLALADPADVHATLTGLEIGDVIHLTNESVTTGTWNGTALTLNGAATAFTISGLSANDTFFFTSDGHSGTYLTVEAAPAVAISAIDGNDVINASDAAAGVAISGTASDSSISLTGQSITVDILNGSNALADTYTTTIAANGSWTVNVTPTQAHALADGAYTVTANLTNAAVDPSPEASQTIVVDEDQTEQAGLSVVVDGGSTTPIGSAGASVVPFTVSGLASDDSGTLTFSDGTHSVVVTITDGAAVTGTNNTLTTVNLSSLADDTSITSSLSLTDTADNSFTASGNVVTLDQDIGEQAGLSVVVDGGSTTPIGSAGASVVPFTVSGLASDDSGTLTFSDGTHSVVVTITDGAAVTGTDNTLTTVNLSSLADDTSITSSLSLTDTADNSFTASGNVVTVAPPLTTDNWSGNAGDGDWTTTGNWDNGVPGSNSEVNITPSGSIVVTFDSGTPESVYSLTTNSNATLDITGGSLTIGNTSDIGGALDLSGGTLDIAADVSVADLTLNNQSFENSGLSGAGTLTITDSLTWDSASTVYVTIDLASTATATVTNTVYLDATLEVDGQLNVDGSMTLGSGYPGGSPEAEGIIEINSDGTVTVGGGDSIGFSGGTPGGYVDNSGLLAGNAPSSTATVGVTVTNESTGIVEAQAGTLDLQGAITGTGSLQIENGATLELDSTSTNTVMFQGSGETTTLLIESHGTTTPFAIYGGGNALPSADIIDLPNIHFDLGADSYSTDVITVSNGTLAGTVTIDVVGGVDSDNGFTFAEDSSGGTEVYDPAATSTSAIAATIAAAGTLDLNSPSSENVTFAGSTGTLVLDQPANFSGQIENFSGTAPDTAHSDVIDLVGIDYNSAQFSEAYSSKTGVLTVSDGTNTASITFDGFAGTFQFASDGNGGTDIYDPPATASSAGSSVDSSVTTTGNSADGATGTITFADADASSTQTASVTPEGSNYVGTFSLEPVTTSNGDASTGWQFDLSNDQINLAPGQVLTQSYDVNVTDPQNPNLNVNEIVSVSIGGPGNDNFVFHPGIGADTIVNFNPQADTIELDHFANIQTIQELASLITTDSHGDAVIELGHNDSITLPGMNTAQLQAVLHSAVHLH
jgi:T5SS/PEP-CTERM-associated repeat protein